PEIGDALFLRRGRESRPPDHRSRPQGRADGVRPAARRRRIGRPGLGRMEERIAPPPDEASVPDTPPATAATAQSQGGGSPPGGDPQHVSTAEPATPIPFRLGDRLRWAAQTPRYERKSG